MALKRLKHILYFQYWIKNPGQSTSKTLKFIMSLQSVTKFFFSSIHSSKAKMISKYFLLYQVSKLLSKGRSSYEKNLPSHIEENNCQQVRVHKFNI